MTALTQSLVETILAADSSTVRFERFCNALVGELEGGIRVVGTSSSWDLGRDGRAVGKSTLFVCATLRSDVDLKAQSDLIRLSKHVKGSVRVYFCSNQRLSEHQCEHLRATCERHLPNGGRVEVLGLQQLAELSVGHSAPLKRCYQSEWHECLLALQDGNPSDQTESHGLRLALMTAAHQDSNAIRRSLYTGAILRALSSRGSASQNEIAKDISDSLRLSRPISFEALQPHCESLVERGILRRHDGRLALTPQGVEELENRETEAAQRLVQGRSVIRTALERGLGQRLADQHFDLIWTRFRECLSTSFYERGQEIVLAVSAFIQESEQGDAPAAPADVPEIQARKVPPFFVDALAEAVGRTSSLEHQREELEVAVRDLFVDRGAEAFAWLLEMAAAYVALCSLGLEVQCGNAISSVLAKTTLILDTDVTLSLLCVGEPHHAAAEAIVRKWKHWGGNIFVAEPVLKEVAHHAAIAHNDYRENQHWLPGARADRIRLIDNAFVRAFAELLANKQAMRDHWRRYIAEFKGFDSKDWSRVYGALTEYGIELLPGASSNEIHIEERARQLLLEAASVKRDEEDLRRAKDKAHRDAELYAAMVRHLRTVRARGSGAMSFLVSSARRLAEVDKKLGATKESRIVVPIPVVLQLLSLAPGVSISHNAMECFLFDDRHRRFTSDLDRILLRVIRESSQIDLPWARRSSLINDVRTRLLEEAEAAGVGNARGDKEVRTLDQFVKDKRSTQVVAETIRKALDNLAIDTHEQMELRELRGKVKELSEQLELLKSKTA